MQLVLVVRLPPTCASTQLHVLLTLLSSIVLILQIYWKLVSLVNPNPLTRPSIFSLLSPFGNQFRC